MCIAHECDPYGFLVVNNKPMTSAQIGRLVGLSPKECDKILAELFDAGVTSMGDDGCIFSRRMVRDEGIRNARAAGGEGGKSYGSLGAEHGSKGGRPRKDKGGLITPLTEGKEPPPSSSSSSSSSKQKPSSGRAPTGTRFDDFWTIWPNTGRKVAKAKCLEAWKRRNLDEHADEILRHVTGMKLHSQWITGFDPAPMTYLNQSRWLDGIPVDTAMAATRQDQFSTAAPATDWRSSNAGIEAMARKLGMQWGDEQWPAFKKRVIAAADAAGEA